MTESIKKMHRIRLGTRGSKLALWQADFVAGELKKKAPDIEVQLKVIKTRGDKTLDVAPSRTGDKGLFTSEIEKELLDGNIDIAVHSLKDLPSQLEDGLCLGAVIKRENPLDVLLSARGYTFNTLPFEAKLGTSSLRRAAQIRSRWHDIRIEPIRGNVETRIKKMHKQGLDGIILAYAGVKRLGFEDMITEIIDPDLIMPAAGQGAIAVEIRQSDTATRDLLQTVHDRPTYFETLAERTFLHTLHGGCQVPAACMAKLKGDRLVLQGLVATLDGREVCKSSIEGNAEDAAAIGKELAERLLTDGADKILRDIGGQQSA
jgi:hydroxymethylbilane synthase